MKHRAVLALFATSLSLSGALMLACSSGDGHGFGDDTTDSGNDSTVSQSDTGTDTSSPNPGFDAGTDAGGNCTPVKGACDIVRQDCPDKNGTKQECVVVNSGSGFATACQAAQASEQLPQGRACCPDNNNNPCLTGLECIGQPCTDGGAKTGRCSPHCCQGDNSACGMSDPEGIAGNCSVTVTIGGADQYYVCTYTEFCKPFGVQACKTPNTACQVQDKFGTANCDPIFNGDASSEHQACGNGCADGLGCFLKQFSDGGQAFLPDGAPADECLYFCHTPNSATPFDGGLLTDAAGHGGCPASEGCTATLDPNSFPAWMSICQ